MCRRIRRFRNVIKRHTWNNLVPVIPVVLWFFLFDVWWWWWGCDVRPVKGFKVDEDKGPWLP